MVRSIQSVDCASTCSYQISNIKYRHGEYKYVHGECEYSEYYGRTMTARSCESGQPRNHGYFSVADASPDHRRFLVAEKHRGRNLKLRCRAIYRPMWGKNGVCCLEPTSPISQSCLCQDERSAIWCVMTLPETTQLPETTHYRGPHRSEIQAKIPESQSQAARLGRRWR